MQIPSWRTQGGVKPPHSKVPSAQAFSEQEGTAKGAGKIGKGVGKGFKKLGHKSKEEKTTS